MSCHCLAPSRSLRIAPVLAWSAEQHLSDVSPPRPLLTSQLVHPIADGREDGPVVTATLADWCLSPTAQPTSLPQRSMPVE